MPSINDNIYKKWQSNWPQDPLETVLFLVLSTGKSINEGFYDQPYETQDLVDFHTAVGELNIVWGNLETHFRLVEYTKFGCLKKQPFMQRITSIYGDKSPITKKIRMLASVRDFCVHNCVVGIQLQEDKFIPAFVHADVIIQMLGQVDYATGFQMIDYSKLDWPDEDGPKHLTAVGIRRCNHELVELFNETKYD